MTTTESLPNVPVFTNRIESLRKLEQSQPIAVRLMRDDTAGPALYSDDPDSTWGFNPFNPSNKTEFKNLFIYNFILRNVSLAFERYFVSFKGQINRSSEPICIRAPWNNKTQTNSVSTFSPDFYYGSLCHSRHIWNVPVAGPSDGLALVAETKAEAETQDTMQLESPTFGWTRSGYRARLAASQFSEHVNGDS